VQQGASFTLRGRNHQAGNPAATDQQGYLYMYGRSGRLDLAGQATVAEDQDIFGSGQVNVAGGGSLTKSSGTATSHIQPASDNDGLVRVDSGTARLYSPANYSSGLKTLSGGTWHLKGRLSIDQVDVQTNMAEVILDGAGAQVDNPNTTAADDGLDSFRTNAAAGDLSILNGRSLAAPNATRPGPFTNDGTLTVDATSALTATGGLQNNGTLRGDGTVARGGAGSPAVTNAGVVRPGTSPGQLTVNGDYVQTAAGKLVTEVAGSNPGTTLDQLEVSGAAALDGTLEIAGSITPNPGASFTILTHGARSGQFATVTGDAIDQDREYQPVYEDAQTRLVVTTATLPDVSIEDPASQAEGDSGTSDAQVTVSLSAPTRRTVTVDYFTSDGTARQPDDYTTRSGRLTFAPGEISKEIAVPVAGDGLDEADETFDVTLSAPGDSTPVNANLPADRTSAVTILDDDPLPAVSIRDEVMVEEGDSGDVTVSVPVRLSQPSGRRVTVDYATENVSGADAATPDSDYTPETGTVTFDPGDPTTKNVEIAVIGDTIDEPRETFKVKLSSPTSATLDPTVSGSLLRIVDNDSSTPPPPSTNPAISIDDVRLAEGNTGMSLARFVVRLSQATGDRVTVDYATSDGTANQPGDYELRSGTLTFSPGERLKVVEVPVNGDATNESDETFGVGLSGPAGGTLDDASGQGTIVNDDASSQPSTNPEISIDDVSVGEGNAGTSQARFVVSLARATGDEVTVNYATQDGSAGAPADYQATNGTLNFAPGERLKVVEVPVKGDGVTESDETFTVALSGPAGGTIRDAAGQGTIIDNDPPPPSTNPGISIDDVTIGEGNSGTSQARFIVSLDQATGDTVKVDYATSNGTAEQPGDYQATNGTLTFAPNERLKTVDVPVNGDGDDESDETFNVALSNATGGATTDATGQGTIVDDDQPQLTSTNPAVSIDDVSLSEGNSGTGEARFVVSLAEATADQVTVNYATSNGSAVAPGDYTATSGTITFNPGERVGLVDVPVNGDAAVEGDETFTVALSIPAGVVATIGDGSGAGTILNDDSPPPSTNPAISIDDVSVGEGDTGTSPARFVVSLAEATGDQVTVNYATQDGSAGAPADYEARSGTLTFDRGEKLKVVEVPVKGDATDERNETFTVALSSPVAGTLGKATGQGTIMDNDEPPVGPATTTTQQPPPPPPPPPPPEPQTLADLPAPVLGEEVNVQEVSGSVLVGIPLTASASASAASPRASQKGLTFVPLTQVRQIPVGSFLDTKKGTVRLQSATNGSGTRQQSDFSAGLFQVLQSRSTKSRGLTELVLKGSSFGSCGKAARGKRASAAGSRTIRRLRASGQGRFRTRGRHSAATVRGTVWDTVDRCDGTLTRVSRGTVTVRDFRRKKNITVRAGKSYLAKAAR